MLTTAEKVASENVQKFVETDDKALELDQIEKIYSHILSGTAKVQ